MFDQKRYQETLVKYKQDFAASNWVKEKYKWQAIKCFKDNWDIDAVDFADMLKRSLYRTSNLLASQNNYPGRMILEFAQAAPEEVRAMFIHLFDEKKDVFERIEAFKSKSNELLLKYKNADDQHFQKENAISTYLWLRYPDKYTIYKFGEVKNVAEELKSDHTFKKGAYAENIRHFYKLYDELNEAFKKYENETLKFTMDPIVSSDVIGCHYGAVVDGLSTNVLDVDGKQLVKVVAWYDNEMSYSSQMVRTAKYLMQK